MKNSVGQQNECRTTLRGPVLQFNSLQSKDLHDIVGHVGHRGHTHILDKCFLVNALHYSVMESKQGKDRVKIKGQVNIGIADVLQSYKNHKPISGNKLAL